MLSKALVIAAYRRKCDLMAPLLGSLTVIVPPAWGSQKFEAARDAGYTLRTAPLRFNGNYHLHYYPTLAHELQRLANRPGLVLHIDEEPYNLATWLALGAAQRVKARSVFFSWQNIRRNYPPPFSWMERHVLRHAHAAIAGNAEAADILRAKGFTRPVHVVPQFGVDEAWLESGDRRHSGSATQFVVGFAGRFVKEKGIDLLLHAARNLPTVQVKLAGDGHQMAQLCALAHQLGIANRVEFITQVRSTEMPSFYHQLDALVLPSRALPNWKEQFGRVLVEAMACGVPVIGARSGEIPNVIGDSAGLLFAEGDAVGLTARIAELMNSPSLQHKLRLLGRERVRAHFTMRRIAEQTVGVYKSFGQDLQDSRA